MSNEKKNKTTMDEGDPVADELIVIDLQRQVAELERQVIELQYQVGGMSDMARMNTAAQLLAAMIERDGTRGPTAIKRFIPKAVEASDELIGHYQGIIERNSVEYTKRISGLESEDDGTVQ